MNPRLVLIDGGPRAVLKLKLPTVVGRGGKASLKVPDAMISRMHCKIYEEDGELVVDDMGSTNGTIVNNYKIEGPTYLEDGCTLKIGKVTFRVQYDAAVMPPSDGEPIELRVDDELDVESAEEKSPAKLRYSESGSGSFIGISATSEEAEAASSGFVLGSDAFREMSKNTPQKSESAAGSEAEAAEAQAEGEGEGEDSDDSGPGDSALGSFLENFK